MKMQQEDSFYERSVNYLKNADPSGGNYLGIKKAIESYVKNKVDLNKYITKNIFANHRDCYETPEEVSDALKLAVASVYTVCTEDKVILKPSDPSKSFQNLQEAIRSDLYEVVGTPMAGDIMDFIESYEG